MLQIPPERLTPETLAALIEEFVTRQGTDLADSAEKAAQVRRLLARGDIVIVFDEATQTCNIVPKDFKPEPVNEDTSRQIVCDDAPPPPDWPD
jgi:uncharacterized protein YheU (UPF0270 family)